MRTHSRHLRVLLMSLLVLFLTVGLSDLVFAAVFFCGAGDVFCLIGSIRSSNEQRGADTIILEAGTYALTAIDNTIDSEPGPFLTEAGNGLPSITGRLTIVGTGPL